MSRSDNKTALLLASGAIAGAAGYLFLTDSGKRVRRSIGNADIGSIIPDKIEDARLFIEKKAVKVQDRVQCLVDRAKESFEAGKTAFDESGRGLHKKLDELDQQNTAVLSNVHRAVDNVHKTVYTVEKTLLEPFYQVVGIVRGVDRGFRKLTKKSAGSRWYDGRRLSG